ncbi:MAG: efflux RND transporter periplasmic adaptor subunit, partial [Clostridia bacterium]
MKNKKAAKIVKCVVAVLVVAALAAGGIFIFKNRKTEETEEAIPTAVATRRTIVNTVTGSGTVEAYETYNIVPKVTGDIIYCNVEEGDWVEEDQVLYRFDSEKSDNAIKTATNSVESAKLSLDTAKENVEKLTVTAKEQGIVSNLTVLVGENVSGNICTLTDNTYMIAEIPVAVGMVGNIHVGEEVSVSLEKYMTTVTATVDRISGASFAGEKGAMVKTVDVKITNPGSIEEGTMAYATFHTSQGDIEGAQAAELHYPSSSKVTAEQSGTLVKLTVKNGDWVNKGQVIAVLENSSVENQLTNATMSYDNAVSNLSDRKKEAEDYTVTSPIAGKVLEKTYKKGDTVAGSNSTTLMVVADTTKMKFTINVDELDVAKIAVGQSVEITADAIEGVNFEGIIENVSMLGTSSSGVTYYPVVVRIDEPGDLMPGMNVSAEIIAERADNVVAVPTGAVTYYDGKYYVTVVGEVDLGTNMGKDMADVGEQAPFEMSSMPEGGEQPPFEMSSMPEGGMGGGMPQGEMGGTMGDMLQGSQSQHGGKGQKGTKGEEANGDITANQTMYEEARRVEVTTGVSDDDYIEIKEGISVGQIVNVTDSSQSSSSGFFGGMG